MIFFSTQIQLFVGLKSILFVSLIYNTVHCLLAYSFYEYQFFLLGTDAKTNRLAAKRIHFNLALHYFVTFYELYAKNKYREFSKLISKSVSSVGNLKSVATQETVAITHFCSKQESYYI